MKPRLVHILSSTHARIFQSYFEQSRPALLSEPYVPRGQRISNACLRTMIEAWQLVQGL